jgi:hypothetical protein
MGSNASRGPQPAQGSASMSGAAPGVGSSSRRRERGTLWQDSMSFHDSFFSSGRRDLDTGMGDLDGRSSLGDADLMPAGMVSDDPAPPSSKHPFQH